VVRRGGHFRPYHFETVIHLTMLYQRQRGRKDLVHE
jgi:hypothetical protein